jgi:glycerol-3-phosphate dehydrogenase (NAD(P)+)
MKRILILGDGGWGTALALVLHEKGHQVTIWGAFPQYVEHLSSRRENTKYLPGITIPNTINFTSDLPTALNGTEYIVAAVPIPFLRSVIKDLKKYYTPGAHIVCVSKGIENETLMCGSQIIRDVLEEQPVALLFGPSHAEEVARKLPTTVVTSAQALPLAEEVQSVFMTNRFRVYTNPDPIGIELGAALKNVIAIAAGICDGLGFGDNSKAALVTRGLTEITRLGVAMGAKKSTFSGLTGLGDLFTTCVSPHGRNRFVGEEIGKGRKLKEILAQMEKVAEGVLTTKSVCALADKHNVEMPISREVYKALFEDKSPHQAVNDLMMRAPRSEVEELE